MAFRAKELREKRAPIKKVIDDLSAKINSEGRAFTAEERETFEKAASEYKSLTVAIQDCETSRSLTEEEPPADRKAGRSDTHRDTMSRKGREAREAEAPTEEHRALALQAWVRAANGLSLKRAHRDACRRLRFNPNQKRLDIKLGQADKRARWEGSGWQSRDMSVGTSTAGGSTVPTDFMRSLEIAMLSFDGARRVADVFRTDTGASMPWPTLNDTGNSGEQIDENTAVASQDAATSSVNFGAYKFSSKLIPLSNELMSDSAFNMAQVVGGLCGERIGRIQNTRFTTGNGTTQPQGIITGASAGVTAAGATAITISDLFNLRGSVDPAYRSDPSTAWMFHDNILTYLLKLQDSQGRPLIQENYRDGGFDRILGNPFAINQAMQSSVATATKTILYGPMRYFKIRDVGVLRLRRLDERYAEKDQTGFVAFMRSDSKVLSAGVAPLKYLTQA